jgi:glycosyltransferase involved in cell wall biosynthesis
MPARSRNTTLKKSSTNQGVFPVKLIIQIPCFNEEETLPITLNDLPKTLKGVSRIEVLIIDDGSTDRTVEVARKEGVNHVVRFSNHKGLAEAFSAGLDASLRLGADIVVNTDADNQYHGEDIQKLIDPILEGRADIVIGDRKTKTIKHFSFAKKRLQSAGSWMVRQLSGTHIPDVTSGFRALNREAALRMNIISGYSYTLEMVIQAGKKNMAITHVPIRTNPKLRPSRLFSSIQSYIKRSVATIVRIYTLYEPLKIFISVGGAIFGLGFVISLRFLYYFMTHQGAGHIQSLILSTVLMLIGFQIILIGLLSDIISANRRLLENILYLIRKREYSKKGRSEDKPE